MKNLSRALAAAATLTLTSSLALGLGVASADAAPHAGHGHTAHVALRGGSHGATAHGKSVDHRTAQAARKIARDVARKDAALARTVTDQRLAPLDPTTADAVRANVAEDRAALAALGTAAAAATTPDELAAVVAQVRTVRPEGYLLVVNQLRHLAGIQAALDTAVATATASGVTLDPTAVQALVDSATTAALDYRASDAWSTLRTVQADIVAAQDALDALTASSTDTTGTTTDPTGTTTDPTGTTTDPTGTTTDPTGTTTDPAPAPTAPAA
ncbi:MAG: hypothetical protein ACXVFU_16580 [Nocardioidaceae bacterium]